MRLSAPVSFLLLGPLRVCASGTDVTLHGERQARLVAALAIEAGAGVSVDRLVEVVWPDDAPATARRQVQDLISRLRRDLMAAGCSASVIARQGRTYRLDVPAHATDVTQFLRKTSTGLGLRVSDPVLASQSLREALGLWRGAVLLGLACPALDCERTALDERRLSTWEQCIELDLALGRHQEVLPELEALVQSHPLREHVVRLFLHALYRNGRTAQAIEAFHQLRRRLADELGVLPGPDVQHMYDAIVTNDQGLMDVSALAAHGRPPWVVPRQLRPDQVDFVGREPDLRALDALVQPGSLVTVTGLGGVGKTTLAVHWAHRAAARFADGQLHLDLRGAGTDDPMPAVEALGLMLQAIGYPASAVPATERQASDLYRSALAGRSVLVILDNAASAAQVRPLLPQSATCAVMVTARHRLTGLMALEGARARVLDVLEPPESLTLLRRIVGSARVATEPREAARLAALAGHLPLALRIAGAHLSTSPYRRIGELVEELAASPLHHLEVAADAQANVSNVFAHSYRTLDEDLRLVFRRIAWVPGPDVGESVAAASVGCPREVISSQLRRLVDAHLVTERAPGRYVLHDLVRAFAIEQADADESKEERTSAFARMIDWYVENARAAALAYAHGHPILHQQRRPVTPMASDDQARSWFEVEIGGITAVICAQPPVGDPHNICLLADAVWPLYSRGSYGVETWKAIATAAHRAALDLADPHAAVSAQLSLAAAHRAAGSYDDGLAQLRDAIAAAAQCGWTEALWAACGNAGSTLNGLGRHEEAINMCLAAATASRTAGRPSAAAQHLINVAIALECLGRLNEAEATLTTTLTDLGPSCAPAGALIMKQNLAMIRHYRGDFEGALTLVNEVLQELDRPGRPEQNLFGCALDTMAAIRRDRGELDAALAAASRAVELMAETHSATIGETLNTRGSILLGLGRPQEALADSRQALDIARQQQSRTHEARALVGMAAATAAAGHHGQARRYATDALLIARDGGLRIVEGQALALLAVITQETGDVELAAQYARQAATAHAECGYAAG